MRSHIVELANVSFDTGEFPAELKHAILIPLLKGANCDINQLKNYRPISLLPFLSKTLEKLVAVQLNDYIEANSLLSQHQSAYRAGYSVETCLLSLQSELLEILDRGNAAFLVLLDLSAAFDTINHDLLLHSLHINYNINDKALEWIKSYLTNRTYQVKVDSKLSDKMRLKTGVPQGSVLGPILFNMFVGQLASIFSRFNLSAYFYADDTQFFVEFDPKNPASENQARDLICSVMSQVSDWMLKNHLKLNAAKTVFLPIHRCLNKDFAPLLINGSSIKPSTNTRNLGFTFTSNLDPRQHINTIKRSSFYHLKRLSKVRSIFSFQQRETLMHAFITSRLDFCNSLFYGSSKRAIGVLHSIQAASARALMGTSFTTPSMPLFYQLHWLPSAARIVFKLAVLGFKILHGSAPKYLSSRISRFKPPRATRSSIAPRLTTNFIPRCVRYGDRTAYTSICQVFNNLPPDIRKQTTLPIFKSRLKTALFEKHFS